MVSLLAEAAQAPTTWPDVALALAIFGGIALILWVILRWMD